MKTIKIDKDEWDILNISNCITYDNILYNKLHDLKIQAGDKIHFIVENSEIWCDVIVEEIEYGDGTIWVKWLDSI